MKDFIEFIFFLVFAFFFTVLVILFFLCLFKSIKPGFAKLGKSVRLLFVKSKQQNNRLAPYATNYMTTGNSADLNKHLLLVCNVMKNIQHSNVKHKIIKRRLRYIK